MPAISRNDHFEDITLTGNLSPGDASRVTNSLIPSTDSAEDLGTAALRWNNVFAGVGGNVAVKPSLNDEYRFVSNSGNDSNDGRSWGTAKLTVASACASITNQDSTCTTTNGFGTILIAPSFSGSLPSCFSSVTVRCPALTVIGPGLLMMNSSVKTYGTFILGTTNSGYTFLQDGFQMVVQSGGPRAAGVILADSTFTLPDAAEGTASAQSGELAAFVGAGVSANKVLISGGLNTSVSGGILKDSGLTASSGKLTLGSVTFSALGAETNGTLVYCSDCTIANPCASGGSGALAKRINGAWICN